MPLNAEKDLPSLPGDGRQMHRALPSTGGVVHATRSRPTLNLEKPLSPEELALLHDRWNEATSARHIRFERQPLQHGRLRSAPPPPSEAENIPVSASRGNDQTSTPTPQRQWGIFTRKKLVADASKSDEQVPSSSKPIRSKKFLSRAKAARSTPDLNASAKADAQHVSPAVPPIPREAPSPAPAKQPAKAPAPATKQPEKPPTNQGGEAPAPELEINLNDGGIYLTFDPDWRTSCGDVVLTFLSPIPDEIPDSPIMHRRHSLDELHRQITPRSQATSTGAKMDPIDELHSFLEY
ncbi:hypothetical protein K503DRAFT_865372 [Rhizopogon vinicolor AM-OR11-026]|uniref:Uncharacterized protein n=1 Tax=Rhizopogon vinicolor AM-OR11-026 TaxID=1314800 RepID=A0A1B7N3S7_9AGAM|nr:hypothetical protein K503DRAFT_865372 [Rhizopogon vinicolor AM-OR11-026]